MGETSSVLLESIAQAWRPDEKAKVEVEVVSQDELNYVLQTARDSDRYKTRSVLFPSHEGIDVRAVYCKHYGDVALKAERAARNKQLVRRGFLPVSDTVDFRPGALQRLEVEDALYELDSTPKFIGRKVLQALHVPWRPGVLLPSQAVRLAHVTDLHKGDAPTHDMAIVRIEEYQNVYVSAAAEARFAAAPNAA